MALISGSNLAKYFGADDIFTDISLDIHADDCVALVGANGCGKSTLLDILAGQLEPDAGTVNCARTLRLGYLPQNPDFESDGTLWEAMEAVFAELLAQQAELRQLEAQMATEDEAAREVVLARYGTLLERFEQAGGFSYEARIGKVLSGLGFDSDEYHVPIAHLSGGEKTRALLARLLLEAPDLLLLDEPTNHLDIEGIEWLEEQLQQWHGAIIVVAHDRAFLDAIANRVMDMHHGTLDSYRGNYSDYVQQRAERRARRRQSYERQQAHIAETEDYIRRNIAGQRTSQAKGRLRRLNRLERFQDVQSEQQIHIDLQTSLRSGDLVVGLYNVYAGYEPDLPLIHVDEVELRRGHCVALVGPNGSGKTTLLRTILREISPLSGRVRIGSAVRMGYFAQVQEHLDPQKTVLDTMFDGGMMSIAEARDFLARYGFRGDDVFKVIDVLSGGERARVALALLTLQKANVLLLDEPTNHLDIPSQEVLQDVISDFNGTVLLVSHDRYLIREVATQVWALADGALHCFDEGYAAYAAWHQSRRNGDSADQSEENAARAQWEAERREQRRKQRALERQQERLAELEAQIHERERRLQSLTLALDTAGREQDIGKVSKLGAEYHDVEKEMNALLEAWAEVADNPVG